VFGERLDIIIESPLVVVLVPEPKVKPVGPYSTLNAVPLDCQSICAELAVTLLEAKKIGAGHGGGKVMFTI
jgi:hypothetical protein